MSTFPWAHLSIMEYTLNTRQIDEIAYKTALIVERRLAERMKKKEQPEMVSTNEAARILNITPGRMRQIAHKYPHIKKGDSKQGQLLFDRKSLIN